MTVTTIDREPAKFLADVQHLSVEEIGAYQIVCDYIVVRGQDADPPSLPDDDRSIAQILGWSIGKWRRVKQRLCDGELAVLTVERGRLTQIRVAAEVLEAKGRIASSSRAGVASGIARQKKNVRERLANGRSTDVPTESEQPLNGKANGTPTECEPLTNNQLPRTKKQGLTNVNPRADPIRTALRSAGLTVTKAAEKLVGRWAESPGPDRVVELLARNLDRIQAARSPLSYFAKIVSDCGSSDAAILGPRDTLGYDRQTWANFFPGIPYGRPKCATCGERHAAERPEQCSERMAS